MLVETQTLSELTTAFAPYINRTPILLSTSQPCHYEPILVDRSHGAACQYATSLQKLAFHLVWASLIIIFAVRMYEEHRYPSKTLEGLSETAFNIAMSFRTQFYAQ